MRKLGAGLAGELAAAFSAGAARCVTWLGLGLGPGLGLGLELGLGLGLGLELGLGLGLGAGVTLGAEEWRAAARVSSAPG